MLYKLTSRTVAIKRTEALFNCSSEALLIEKEIATKRLSISPNSYFTKLIYQSGYSFSPLWLVAASLLCMLSLSIISSLLVAPFAVAIYAIIGASFPILYLNRAADKRASQFGDDYPTVLLAMASSLKVGHTPLDALNRAVQLLPKSSSVRIEVETLIDKLHSGMAKHQVISQFADSYRLPDLELFRTAFAIVLENGGQFAHTLQRLSDVSRDRSTLIRAAEVTTVTMRMTANFLLAVAPLLLLIISVRSETFWSTLTTNSIANNVATVGIILITASYLLLRKMSAFRP